MSLLAPTFLLLGLLAGPIILLYMLRLRRREVVVSSTMLWQKLLRDREANAPWQKLRRNLLLLLQLLILAALVFALARPFFPTPSLVQGNAIVLLDASASMQAVDVAPNRFEAGKQQVEDLIDDLRGNNQMTLIHVGQTPSVLAAATNDRSALRGHLATAQPEAGTANWEAAVALANGAAQGFREAQIFIVSDGGLPTNLPPLPHEPVYIPIGSSSENVALTALATRNTPDGPQLFASVENSGTRSQSLLLNITLDGTLFDSRQLTIGAGETGNEIWTLPGEVGTIEARLSDQTEDFLPLDDTAWAIHDGGVTNRTLLITGGNIFLEQILGVLPGLELFQATPESETVTNEAFDLVVFDSTTLPETLPNSDLLIIGPQINNGSASDNINDLFTPTAVFSDTIAVRVAESPLLQFVEWRDIHIQQAQGVEAAWAETLVAAEGGPLLLAGERNGRRIAILTFDIRASDLPLQIAFPILMANITSWLRPGGVVAADTAVAPGRPVALSPSASATAVQVIKPDGIRWETAVTSTDQLFFDETEQLGLYQINLVDESGNRLAGQFGVNLFAPAESAIAPAAALQIGQTAVPPPQETAIGQYELWPWLLAVALLILLIEWWVYHRGTQRPSIKFR
ncbi:MAG: VWA domain-containing protein [Chloroflexota bacterium]